ncbi:MAG: transcription termination factor Rho [Desulfobacteraceae bacterium]
MEEETTQQQDKKQEDLMAKSKQKHQEIGKPLEKMTATELREVAMEIPGVAGAHAMKKDELLDLIREAWDLEQKGAAAGKRTRTGATVKELKEKIARIKEEKQEARKADDKARVEVLRRRMNRLKKQTRKAARA